MKSIEIEVIAPVVNSFDHCQHCQVFIDGAGIGGQVRRDDIESYPAEFLQDYQNLSDSILSLVERYPNQVTVRVIDPATAVGMWKSIRHVVRRYPTWIVAGREKVVGLDDAALDQAIEGHLAGE